MTRHSSKRLSVGSADTAPFIFLPLSDGSSYPINQRQCAEWGTLFPAVDVPQELRKVRAFLLAYSRARKTRNGVLPFVTSWLSREQGRLSRSPARDSHDIRSKIKAA